MFSRKTRQGLLGGVALALAGLMAGEAGAMTGAIITPDFCKSPESAIMWLRFSQFAKEDKLESLYFMKDNGELILVQGEDNYRELKHIAVLTPDSCHQVHRWNNESFAENLADALPNKDEIKTIVSVDCNETSDDQSLASSLSWLMSNAAVRGWEGRVQLVQGERKNLFSDTFVSSVYMPVDDKSHEVIDAINFNTQVFWNTMKYGARTGFVELASLCEEINNPVGGVGDVEIVDGLNFIIQQVSATLFPDNYLNHPLSSAALKAAMLAGEKNYFTCTKQDWSYDPICE